MAETSRKLPTDNTQNASTVDSLLECMLLLFKFHDSGITREAALAGLPLVEQRVTPQLVERIARRAHFATNLIPTSLPNINRKLLPAILLLKNNRACLLHELDPQTGACLVAYPELGEACQNIALEELTPDYIGQVIYLRPRFRFDSRSAEVGRVKRRHWFWSVMGKNLPLYRDVLLAAFLVSLFALATPLFVRNVYDRVVPNQAFDTLWVLASGLAIVLLGDIMLRTMRSYFLDLASKRVDVKLSAFIMERVLGARLEHKPISAGSFASNLRSFEMVRDFITSATVTAFIDLPFSLIFFLAIGLISWPLTIPIAIGLLTVIISALIVQRKMHELAELTYRAGAQRNATLIESLVGLETLKSLGAEGRMQSKWETSVAYLAQISNRLRLLSAGTMNMASWVSQTVNLVLIITGVYLIADNKLTMGGLIACSMLSSRAMAPISQIAGLLTQYHHATTAFSSLNEILAHQVERPEETNFISRQQFDGGIDFKNVDFLYPQQESDVLRNLAISIKPGEHIAILGRIGAGKSTLLKMLLGLYQPSDGSISIDGIDMRQIDPAELRRSIGYVSQDITLFYGSLKENLTLANPQAEDGEIIAAAQAAGLLDFVNSHPQGFDMLIGERGESLSGGQRQCVALARAFIKNPSILLLDEPTGSMDHSSEEHVKTELRRFAQNKTMILVSHRTALLDLVERIVVMDSGKIVADGPKDQVIEALRQGRIGKAS
jgi:ATP-binding cassette subfamily C protein LapB